MKEDTLKTIQSVGEKFDVSEEQAQQLLAGIGSAN